MNLLPHKEYFKYLIRHKYWVWVAGRQLGVPLWRLLVHDWSKFTPVEWFPYVTKFYGKWKQEHPPIYRGKDRERFDKAWLHHQHHNPHHWQHWLLREDSGGDRVLPIPDTYVAEMVADWCGAGMAITGKWDVVEWYEKNKDKMHLHPRSRENVEAIIYELVTKPLDD
ncbi:MAG: DUF5662 family protein [Bacilli bacterium]